VTCNNERMDVIANRLYGGNNMNTCGAKEEEPECERNECEYGENGNGAIMFWRG